MSVAKPLHLRLFIEGIEVPVVGAQVSIHPNAPAAASIQVVPLDEAMDLKPRSMVHLFFLDTQTKIEKKDGQFVGTGITGAYRLLFSGETIGFSFVRTPMNRAVILQCVDFSSYWDAAHATAIEYGPFGNLFTHMGGFYGSNTGLFDDIINQQQNQLVSWIQQSPSTPGLTSIKPLAGGIIHMMEMMGGVPGHYRGVNDFFTIAELRCRLLSQITAEENDNTASNLLYAKVFDQWLRNGLQNMGQQVTFRDMMKMLFSYIYYDVVPNPAAKLDAYKPGTTKTVAASTTALSGHPLVLAALPHIRETSSILKKVVDATSSSVPDKDIQESAGLRSASVTKALELLRKLTANSQALTTAKAKLEQAVTSLNLAKTAGGGDLLTHCTNAYKAVMEADSQLQSSDSVTGGGGTVKVSDEAARLHSQIIRPDCWFAAPPRCNVIFPEQYTQLTYDRILVNEVTRSMVMIYNTLIHQPGDPMAAFLADRAIAPNISKESKGLVKKAAKASYSVLMPHEYHTGIIPRIEWLSNIAAGSGSQQNPKEVYGAQLGWAEKVALFHFFKFRFGPRTLAVTARFSPNLVCGFPGVLINQPFIVEGISKTPEKAVTSSLADFVNDRALKYGAPAQFVGLIDALNHSVDQGGGTTQLSMSHCRKHIGVDDEFFSVFSQKQIRRTKRVRIPLRYADLKSNIKLLTLLAEVTPQPVSSTRQAKAVAIPKTTEVAGYYTDEACVLGEKPEPNPLTDDDYGLSAPEADTASCNVVEVSERSTQVTKTEIVGGQKVTSTKTKKIRTSSESPLTSAASKTPTREGKIPGLTRKVLTPSPSGTRCPPQAGVYGKLAGIEVVDARIVDAPEVGKRVYAAVVLHEDIDLTSKVSIPLEEMLFPGWFSSKYRNDQIGKNIYEPFFGTTSIVDELAVSMPNGFSASSVGNPEGEEVAATRSLSDLVAELSEEEARASLLSIERAVNLVAYLYGTVRAQGLDVDAFIDQYTRRPIATHEEMLGSDDLSLAVTGNSVKVTKGSLGYHTMAVHPDVVMGSKSQRLLGLLTDPNLTYPRLGKEGRADRVLGEYDVRLEKREQVLKYVVALQKGPAFRG